MNLSDHFAMLWETNGPPPDVFAFLKAHPELPLASALEIFLIDLHHRWRAGSAVPVEAYFRACPAVANDPEMKLDLVFSELQLAAEHERGRPPISPAACLGFRSWTRS